MAVAAFLVFFCAASFLLLLLRKSSVSKFMRKFPGLMIQSITNLFYFRKLEERLERLTAIQKAYGNRIQYPVGPIKVFFLFHPDDVAKILLNKDINKSSFYEMLFTNWIGSSLFYSKDQDYFKKRKLILPAFDFKHVDNFELNCNEHSKKLLELLKAAAIKDEAADIHQLLTYCALDIATRYTLGKSTESLSNFDNKYAEATHNELKYVSDRLLLPWLWPDFLWNRSKTGQKEKASRTFLQNFFDKFVQNRKKEFVATKAYSSLNSDGVESGGKEKLKLLDLLIREQQRSPGLTDKYLREELNFVTFAAHDTVASAMTFAVFLLASHPEQQAELHLELDSVFGEDRDRDIEALDLPNLKFLECCFKETLRLFPSAPIFLRAIEKDMLLDKDVTIPKGIHVAISPWVTHRLPEFFPEPDLFKPSRFFPENSIGRHPYSFIPFSAGPRNCLGQKIAITKSKIVLANIFRKFIVQLESPPETMVPIGSMVLYPKDGLKIKLKLR